VTVRRRKPRPMKDTPARRLLDSGPAAQNFARELKRADIGDRFEIHAEDCALSDGASRCTCEPIRVTQGGATA
jgi:hypothetical protein